MGRYKKNRRGCYIGRNRFKISVFKFILWIFIFVIILSFLLIYIFNIRFSKVISRYSNVEVKRFANNLINTTVNEEIGDFDLDNLFIVTTGSDGVIKTIDYNTKDVNQLLENITRALQDKIILLESGDASHLNLISNFSGKNFYNYKYGVIAEIPFGIVFNNTLLTNIGPVIPLRFSFVGYVSSNLNTKVKNYGINNLYLEMSAVVEINMRITLPANSEDVSIVTDVPIHMKVIQGVVPDFYSSGLGRNSNLYSLPTDGIGVQ